MCGVTLKVQKMSSDAPLAVESREMLPRHIKDKESICITYPCHLLKPPYNTFFFLYMVIA
jgi:hypothetical protein